MAIPSVNASDLWEEYRRECCPGECGEALHYQRLAFLGGIVAACGTVCMGVAPGQLAMSSELAFVQAIDDFQVEQAERN